MNETILGHSEYSFGIMGYLYTVNAGKKYACKTVISVAYERVVDVGYFHSAKEEAIDEKKKKLNVNYFISLKI